MLRFAWLIALLLLVTQMRNCRSQPVEANSGTDPINTVIEHDDSSGFFDWEMNRTTPWESVWIWTGFEIRVSLLRDVGLAGDMAFCEITAKNNTTKGKTTPGFPSSGFFKVYSVESIPKNLSIPYCSIDDQSRFSYLKPGETESCIAAFRLPFLDDTTVFPTKIAVRFHDESRDVKNPPRQHEIILTGRLTDRQTLMLMDGRKFEQDQFRSQIDYVYVSQSNGKWVAPYVTKLMAGSFTRQYFEFLIAYDRILGDAKLPFEDVVRQVNAELQKLGPPLYEYVVPLVQNGLKSHAYERGFKPMEQLIQRR